MSEFRIGKHDCLLNSEERLPQEIMLEVVSCESALE